MHILALPAFRDNYIWMIHDTRSAVVVDPGDADVVLAACAEGGVQPQGLQLAGILVTHHHPDHTGGLAALLRHAPVPVWGPAAEDIAEVSQGVADGDEVVLQAPALRLRVIEVPGHTLGHVAYHAERERLLLCGDTLFSAGCGRLFEGTPAQMVHSLQRLAALPADTQVLCAHEYTLSNLQFARHVEPGNPAIESYQAWCEQRRGQRLPTLPSTIGREGQVNPFLRGDRAAIREKLEQQWGRAPADGVEAFAMLRQWKDDF